MAHYNLNQANIKNTIVLTKTFRSLILFANELQRFSSPSTSAALPL